MDDVRFVPLGGTRCPGRYAVVDAIDFERVSQHHWWAVPDHNTVYAFGKVDGKVVSMHRFIMGAPVGVMVDHEDRDGLNNRRKNLRYSTNAQNQANGRHRKNATGYRGVSLQGGRYRAQIRIEGRITYLGRYDTPEDAAVAYDRAARKLHGEFAEINFKGVRPGKQT